MNSSVGGSAVGAVVGGALVGEIGVAVGVGGIAVNVEERVGVTAADTVDVVVDAGAQAAVRIAMKISTIIRLHSLIILPPGWQSLLWLWLVAVEMILPCFVEGSGVRLISPVYDVFQALRIE